MFIKSLTIVSSLHYPAHLSTLTGHEPAACCVGFCILGFAAATAEMPLIKQIIDKLCLILEDISS